MPGEDLREFFDIAVNVRIQFRAEDNEDLPPQELCVETRVREGGAVSGDEQVRVLKIRGCGVQECELDRPLPELG